MYDFVQKLEQIKLLEASKGAGVGKGSTCMIRNSFMIKFEQT